MRFNLIRSKIFADSSGMSSYSLHQLWFVKLDELIGMRKIIAVFGTQALAKLRVPQPCELEKRPIEDACNMICDVISISRIALYSVQDSVPSGNMVIAPTDSDHCSCSRWHAWQATLRLKYVKNEMCRCGFIAPVDHDAMP